MCIVNALIVFETCVHILNDYGVDDEVHASRILELIKDSSTTDELYMSVERLAKRTAYEKEEYNNKFTLALKGRFAR